LQQNVTKLPRTTLVRKKLQRIARAAAALVQDIKDPEVLFALLNIQRSKSEAVPGKFPHQMLAESCDAVIRLRQWALSAREPLGRKTTAQKRADNHRWFVSNLDLILFKHTEQNVRRSTKFPKQPYVTACFQAADPKIGPGAIDEAIKPTVTRRRSARGEVPHDNEH